MATQLEQVQPALDKLAKSHVCSQCHPAKLYGSLDALRRHRKTHHSGIKPSWQCPKCKQKPFPRKDHLTRHMKEKHTGEHMKECELCFRTFSNRYLKEHMETCKSRSFGQATEPPPKKAPVVELQWKQPTFTSPPMQAADKHTAPVLEQAPRLRFVRASVAKFCRTKTMSLQQREEIDKAIKADDVALLTTIIRKYGEYRNTMLSRAFEKSWNRDSTFLHHAAAHGSIQVARMLLSAGFDINSQGEALRTPLHEAAESIKVKMVEFLVQQGADVNVRDPDGRTALFYVCHSELDEYAERRALAVINILLERGASIAAEDRWNATVLCVAATYEMKLVAKKLLEAGASVDGSLKANSLTPLIGACYCPAPAIVHMLLEYGADVNRYHYRPGPPNGQDLDERRLFDQQADVAFGHIQSRWTALAYACGPYANAEDSKEMISRLLAAGADPNLGDVCPLEIAVLYGEPDVVKILLDAGADPSRMSDACVGTLLGLRWRSHHWSDRERKEKMALLRQYYRDMFADKAYF